MDNVNYAPCAKRKATEQGGFSLFRYAQ